MKWKFYKDHGISIEILLDGHSVLADKSVCLHFEIQKIGLFSFQITREQHRRAHITAITHYIRRLLIRDEARNKGLFFKMPCQDITTAIVPVDSTMPTCFSHSSVSII